MARLWQFQVPTQIHFGRGALRELGEAVRPLAATVLLVGYRERVGMEESYDRAVHTLQKAGLAVQTFFRVSEEPGEEIILEGARRAVVDHAQAIVGLGGGSVLDAAKGIAALTRLDGALGDFTLANPERREITEALPVVAVPTTAGTGSEVSPAAVFHLPADTPGAALKVTLSAAALTPRVAVVDPDLTRGCPPPLVASAAGDALGHAVEACLSRRANPLTSLLATEAVRLIHRHLPQAVAVPEDAEPREPLALAALLAGLAFSGAGVGGGHALAHALGGVLQVPHGLAVAVATRASLRFNAESAESAYAALAEACGLEGESPAEQAARFVEATGALLDRVGLPPRIAVADAPADLIARLVQNARQSLPQGLTCNPRKLDDAALAGLFQEVLEPR